MPRTSLRWRRDGPPAAHPPPVGTGRHRGGRWRGRLGRRRARVSTADPVRDRPPSRDPPGPRRQRRRPRHGLRRGRRRGARVGRAVVLAVQPGERTPSRPVARASLVRHPPGWGHPGARGRRRGGDGLRAPAGRWPPGGDRRDGPCRGGRRRLDHRGQQPPPPGRHAQRAGVELGCDRRQPQQRVAGRRPGQCPGATSPWCSRCPATATSDRSPASCQSLA